jgi:transcriptional regulator
MTRHHPQTHEEIAAALGMSRQNVQWIERNALLKLLKLRKAMGSTVRGPHRIYESEGIPEPPADTRSESLRAARRRAAE